jgi:hypothetical protein
MNLHDQQLDDVAAYALGALSGPDAALVNEHLRTCAECLGEYDALRPATTALAYSAEACFDGTSGPVASPLLKARIMRGVRSSSASGPSRRAPMVWPAYLVAAACLVIAMISTIGNMSLSGQLKSQESDLASSQSRTTNLSHELADQRTMLADLMSGDAKRFTIDGGQVVARGQRLYIAMHDMPTPPKGKVYQAWTLAKGAKAVSPSVTFVPDARGVAVVALPENAQDTAEVAVSVEPDGGSKAPTTKPIALVALK